MKKVMLIAPYQGMVNVVNNMDLPLELDVSVKVANLNKGVNLAIEAERQGYDFIISRGGTATLIEQAVSIPVIHIDITGYDILRIFTMITGIDTKVALVGFPNISEGAATICSILEYNVKLVTIESQEEVEVALWNLKSEGYSVVIGDVVTVDYAQKVGLQGILLTSGKEAILDSFKVGIRVYEMLKNNKAEHFVSKQVLESLPLPVVIMNKEGDLVFQNKSYVNNFNNNQILSDKKISNTINNLSNNEEYIHYSEKESIMYKFKAFDISIEEKIKGIIIEVLESDINNNLFYTEKVRENPHIVGISDTAKKISRLINNYNELGEKILIIGELGTGKKTFAKAVHYKKFGSNIPFYYLEATDLLNCTSDEIMDHLNSILIGSIMIFNMDKLPFKKQKVILDYTDKKIQMFFSSNIPLNFTSNTDDNSIFYNYKNENSSVHLPPLKSRKEDIKYFLNYYLAELNAEKGLEILGIKDDALIYLENHSWNGNITQLKKVVKEISLSIEGHYIELKDVKFLKMYSKNLTVDNKEIRIGIGKLKDIEKQIIKVVLESENGNQSRAAKKLGINRSTLWRKLND